MLTFPQLDSLRGLFSMRFMAEQTPKSGGTWAGWVLLVIACGLSIVPTFGFLAWFVGGPLLLAAFILSVVAMSRGLAIRGIFLMLATLAAAIFIANTPVVVARLGPYFAQEFKQGFEDGMARREASPPTELSPSIKRVATPAPIPKSASLARSIGVQTNYGLLQIRAGTPVKIVSESPKGLTIDVSGQRITVEREALAFE